MRKVLVAQSCLTLCDPMDCSPPRLFCPWNSPSKHTAVGSHSLLQRIFLIQESNLGLLHCRQVLYCLNHERQCIFSEQIPEYISWQNSQVGRSNRTRLGEILDVVRDIEEKNQPQTSLLFSFCCYQYKIQQDQDSYLFKMRTSGAVGLLPVPYRDTKEPDHKLSKPQKKPYSSRYILRTRVCSNE